jgi:hypothetical protein
VENFGKHKKKSNVKVIFTFLYTNRQYTNKNYSSPWVTLRNDNQKALSVEDKNRMKD